MFKKLLIIVVIDLLLICCCIYLVHPYSYNSWDNGYIILFLIIVNLVWSLKAVIVSQFRKNRSDGIVLPLIVNAIISPFMYIYLNDYASKKNNAELTKTKTYYFSVGNVKYTLDFVYSYNKKYYCLEKRFYICDCDIGKDTSTYNLFGAFNEYNDTIFLHNSFVRGKHKSHNAGIPFQLIVTGHKLIGFPLHESELTLKDTTTIEHIEN